jgi:hypothetical protein
VTGLRDHERLPCAHDATRLAEDHLQVPRVAVRPGKRRRELRRLDVREPDDASFRLRHQLLRQHDDVVVAQLDHAHDVLGDNVPFDQLRDALQRMDLDHSRPVTRSPVRAR